MPHKRKPKTVQITNPGASRLPRPLGEYSPTPPAPEPVTPKPRRRVGESFRDSEHVRVTNPEAL
jgi:hypothetical protein